MDMQRRSLLTGMAAMPAVAGADLIGSADYWINDNLVNRNYAGFELETYAGIETVADLPLADDAHHLLSRTSFGIRRDELEHVRAIGNAAYIEEQLQPDLIPDALCEAEVGYSFTAYFLPRRLLTYYYSGRAISPDHSIENGLKQTLGRIGIETGGLASIDDPLWNEIHFGGTTAGPHRAEAQLRGSTIYRAMLSKRQLYEVMVEFWSNHFNIYAGLSRQTRIHKLLDDREVIRPNALGLFRNLLTASARSTAMLYYLDGVSNVKGAPNENYAREIMELHTLGIDAMDAEGGYTETDVQEVARCFTGWTVDETLGDFKFDPARHDDGEKWVMGQRIAAGGGINDGLQVIDILVNSRFTALNVARKLIRRFVCDTPEPQMVEDLADVFEGHHPALNAGQFGVRGDVRAMLRYLLNSPGFLAAKDRKFKRPFEFYLSAIRATGAGVKRENGRILIIDLEALGQVPHDWELPTGYPDEIGYWSSSAWTLRRWTESAAIGGGRNYPTFLDVDETMNQARTAAQIVENLRQRILHRELKPQDRTIFETFVHGAGGQRDAEMRPAEAIAKASGVIGLMLSSPYFQAR